MTDTLRDRMQSETNLKFEDWWAKNHGHHPHDEDFHIGQLKEATRAAWMAASPSALRDRIGALVLDLRNKADINTKAAKGVIGMSTTKTALREAARVQIECAAQIERLAAQPAPAVELDFGSPDEVIAGLDKINAHNKRQWCNKCGFQPCSCFKVPTPAVMGEGELKSYGLVPNEDKCGDRFYPDGQTLLCQKPIGHGGWHESGDYEWKTESLKAEGRTAAAESREEAGKPELTLEQAKNALVDQAITIARLEKALAARQPGESL